jgi:hypothetical protein
MYSSTGSRGWDYRCDSRVMLLLDVKQCPQESTTLEYHTTTIYSSVLLVVESTKTSVQDNNVLQ